MANNEYSNIDFIASQIYFKFVTEDFDRLF
jgi:hypothetical protein